jgi:ubiquinone/menaquinone biosynthesis C-methylase UbiE
MQSQDYFDQIANQWDTLSNKEDIIRLNKMVDSLAIEEGSNILDIGCGTGVLIPVLLQKIKDTGKLVAIDSSHNMLQKAEEKYWAPTITFLQADVHALPLANDAFDLAICYSSFPHFDDKPAALAEIARVLKIKGTVVINHTASRKEINMMHHRIGGAVKNHAIPEEIIVRQMLEDAGFTNINIHNNPDSYLVTAQKKTALSRKE